MNNEISLIHNNNIKETDRFVNLQLISDLGFVKVDNLYEKIVLHYCFSDKDLVNKYKFEVEYNLISNPNRHQRVIPKLKLLFPQIQINLDIHMLTKGEICYIYPGDILYNRAVSCSFAVEQSLKWAFGYEFYLKEHYWPFAEMPHGEYPLFWGFSRPN